jgi:hypothetical protein
MAMIKPSAPKYDPEDDLGEPGQYLAVCAGVRRGMLNRNYPDGKPLMAIEFRVTDGPDAAIGKKVSIVCSESVYRDPKTGKESRLLQHARMMGCSNPEQGVDPDSFVGRTYQIQVEQVSDRCYVRVAMPVRSAGDTPVGRGRPAVESPPPPDVHDDTVPF